MKQSDVQKWLESWPTSDMPLHFSIDPCGRGYLWVEEQITMADDNNGLHPMRRYELVLDYPDTIEAAPRRQEG